MSVRALPTERDRQIREAVQTAERRAAARRFAAFQNAEVVALLLASCAYRDHRRGLAPGGTFMALVGVARELELEVDSRLERGRI